MAPGPPAPVGTECRLKNRLHPIRFRKAFQMEMAPPERGLSFLFGSVGFGEVHKAVDMGPIGKESDEIVIVVDAVDEGALTPKAVFCDSPGAMNLVKVFPLKKKP